MPRRRKLLPRFEHGAAVSYKTPYTSGVGEISGQRVQPGSGLFYQVRTADGSTRWVRPAQLTAVGHQAGAGTP